MGSGQIYYVSPWKVYAVNQPTERDIKSQIELLNRQGQIVPLFAKRNDLTRPHSAQYEWSVNDLDDYSFACAQVMAAQRLDWPTIIVTDSLEED